MQVSGGEISIYSGRGDDYISLTDMARQRNPGEPKDVIKNWMRNRNTIEFLGLWEKINNPDFKGVEFDPLLFQSGRNIFTLSPSKWIRTVNAIGIVSRGGRNGGTYAQRDIAFEFASWISPEFKLYLIMEFQRLKADEQHRQSLEWSVSRTLAKVNYRIHTDAIKEHLIPKKLSKQQLQFVYSSEADILNMALFVQTAAMWRNENPGKEGKIRDHATLEQLVASLIETRAGSWKLLRKLPVPPGRITVWLWGGLLQLAKQLEASS